NKSLAAANMDIGHSRSDRRESSVATLVNNPIAAAMYGTQGPQLGNMQRRASSQTVVAGEQQQQPMQMMQHNQSAFAAIHQQQQQQQLMQNHSGSLLDFDLDMELARPLEQLWGATPFDASLFMMPGTQSAAIPGPQQQTQQQQAQQQTWPTSAGFPMPSALLGGPGLDAITSTIFDTRFIDARASALGQTTPSESAAQPGDSSTSSSGGQEAGPLSSNPLQSPVPLH
ncbi:hypothetical protein EC988_009908, partial [Linderina pennispora]